MGQSNFKRPFFCMYTVLCNWWYDDKPVCFHSAAGYLELPDVFRVGFVTALVNTLIWGVVGSIWWKFSGLY